MKSNNRKINLIFAILVFLLIIIFTRGLFSAHYTSDSWNYFALGFETYALKWFLPVGRFVGTAVLLIVSKLNINYFEYSIGMEVISVFLATATIMTLYKMIIYVANMEDKSIKMKLLVLVVSIFTIINNGSYQYFYYSESAVMWFGVLFSMLSVKALIAEKPLLLCMYAFFAVNCYQATILISMPLAIILLYYKQNFDLRKTIIRTVKFGIVIVLSLLMNYVILMIIQKILGAQTYKDTSIVFNFGKLNRAFEDVISGFDNFPMSIKSLYLIVFEITIACVHEYKLKCDKLDFLFFSIFTFASSVFLPAFMIGLLDFYFADRIIYSYTSIVGLSFIIVILYLKLEEMKQIQKRFIGGLAVFILVFDVLIFNFVTREHITTNNIDLRLGKHIANLITDYELESGNKIERVEYCYDSSLTLTYFNSKKTGEATRRALSGDWCFENVLNYIMNRELAKTENQELHETVFGNKEWNEFSDEQIKFENEVMYYCIY